MESDGVEIQIFELRCIAKMGSIAFMNGDIKEGKAHTVLSELKPRSTEHQHSSTGCP